MTLTPPILPASKHNDLLNSDSGNHGSKQKTESPLNITELISIIECAMPFADVDTLTDDEAVPATDAASSSSRQLPARSFSGLSAASTTSSKGKTPPVTVKPSQLRGKLGLLVNQVCQCVRKLQKPNRESCLKQFRGDVEPLFKLVFRLRQIHKQDMDNEVLCFFGGWITIFWVHYKMISI